MLSVNILIIENGNNNPDKIIASQLPNFSDPNLNGLYFNKLGQKILPSQDKNGFLLITKVNSSIASIIIIIPDCFAEKILKFI